MDLTNYDVRAAADAGSELHLRNPFDNKEKLIDENGEPVIIYVVGRDSNRVSEKQKEIERRKAEGEEITNERAGIELIAASITGWSENISIDGDPLPYSYKNAIRILTDPRTEWIGEQVGPFSLSRRNFKKNVRDNS